jgi:uncharacterized membrane protein (UPF0127 family)
MASKWITIGLVVGILLLAMGARDDIRRALQATSPSRTQTIGSYGRATVSFSDATVTALIPTSDALQAKGLAGRTHLTDREGMLWLYPQSGFPAFWMKDMLIPIDILWINGQTVVDIAPSVPPPATDGTADLPIYRPDHAADAVLEVAAGFAHQYDIVAGDRAIIDRR